MSLRSSLVLPRVPRALARIFGLALILHAWPALGADEEQCRTDLLGVCINRDLPGYHYLNGGRPALFEATMAGMGSPVAYRGPRRLRFHAREADLVAAPDGAPVPPICEVLLPAEDRVLLIFSFAGPDDSRPSVRAVGASTKGLKAGDYRIFNFSRADVGIILGDRKVGLAAGKDTTLSSPAWRDQVADLSFQLAIAENGSARRIHSSVWGHRPERRMFVFLLGTPDPARPLEVRRTYDVPSVAADAGRVEAGGATDP